MTGERYNSLYGQGPDGLLGRSEDHVPNPINETPLCVQDSGGSIGDANTSSSGVGPV